ncbi:hypothetical protein J4P41_15055, partial [Gluconobacter sp. NFX36]|uniref:hypothetical protein n=1 Tax=Gluconobacter sp. NFX36 TaxID=2819535 RepID=UPI003CEEE663
PGQPLFNIKETRLLHLPSSPINAGEMESQRNPQIQKVFRTLQIGRVQKRTCSDEGLNATIDLQNEERRSRDDSLSSYRGK